MGFFQTAGYFQYYDAAGQATLVKGMDVNHNQYPINWTTAFNAGARFVYMKAGGNTFNFHTTRYVRIFCNGNSVDATNIFSELKVFDIGGTERAGGQPVTSSIAPTAGALANFVDGNTATTVTIGTGLQWIEVDLGASFNIRYIQLWQPSGRTFFNKIIEYSTDNIIFNIIYNANATGTGNYVESSAGAIIVTADTSGFYAVDAQMLAVNVANARAAGLKVGFYWFKNTNYYDVTALSWKNTTADAVNEATIFAGFISSQLSGGDYGDIYPILDFENALGTGDIYPSVTNDNAYNFIEAFINQFKLLSGKPVMLYTFQAGVNSLATTPNQLVHSTKGGIGKLCPIWLAATDTGAYPTSDYLAFGGFVNNQWTAWQYSPTGVGATYGVATATVDLDFTEHLSSLLITSTVFTQADARSNNTFVLYILDGKSEKVLAVASEQHYSSLPFWSAQHFEQINGEDSFSFTCAGDHRDSAFIVETNLVGFYDLDNNFQLFEITKIAEVHGDTLEKQVSCEHQAVHELNDEFVNYVIYAEETASAMAIDVLSVQSFASRWAVGTVQTNPTIPTNTVVVDHASKMEAIFAIASTFNLEMKFRVTITNGIISGRFVDLLVQRGTDVGKRFIYNRDMVSLEQNVDTTTLKTALYGFGKSVDNTGGKARVDFTNVAYSSIISKPVGQNWVESTSYKALYGRAGGTINRFGFYSNSSETDPVKILNQTIVALRQNNTPRLEFRTTAVDLEVLTGHSYEAVRLGDTVRVIDQYVQPAVKFVTRIFEITRDYSMPEKTEIVMQNVTRRNITQDGVKITASKDTISNNKGVWQDSGYSGNGVSDHSFELLETTGSAVDANGTWAIRRPLNSDYFTWYWNNTSTPSTSVTNVNPGPRFVSALWNQIILGTSFSKKTISDFQAIVVGTSKRNPKQLCSLSNNNQFQGPYSMSAYVASFPGTTANGKARLEAWGVGSGSTRIALLGSAEIDLLKSSDTWYKWQRIGIPNMRGLSTKTNFVEVSLTQGLATPNTVYVADAVQFTPTDFPVTYQPESVGWNNTNDLFGYFKRKTYIQAYPTSNQPTPAATSFVINFKKLSTAYDAPNITLASKINDPLKEWSTSLSKFVPRRNGHYQFDVGVRWGQGAGGGLVEHFVEVNGINRVSLSYWHNMPSCSQTNGSAVLYITRGSTVRIVGFTNNASTINSLERMTHLRIKRLAF
jgi:phage minor structural protein